MHPDRLISSTLRQALRTHGFAKLAHSVLLERGYYPPADTSVAAAGRALCMKLAVDLTNRTLVQEGIAAYKEIRRGQ